MPRRARLDGKNDDDIKEVPKTDLTLFYPIYVICPKDTDINNPKWEVMATEGKLEAFSSHEAARKALGRRRNYFICEVVVTSARIMH
jgi:uncharacterized OB-fold protein